MMTALIEWLKWTIARRELETLSRYRTATTEAGRWLAEFPDAASAVAHVDAWAEGRGGDLFDISRLRESMRDRRDNTSAPTISPDTELLNFLDRHADVRFSFDRASIEVDVPEDFEGANLVREVIQAAKDLEDAQ